MRFPLFFCLIFMLSFCAFSQEREKSFDVLPYGNGTFSGKEGFVEAGPEFEWDYKLIGKSFYVRPALRLPLTETNENNVQIDRFSPKWRAILAMEYGSINNLECVKKDGYSLGLQLEYGLSNFKYYPTANLANPVTESGSSFVIEAKYISFYTLKQLNAKQLSPQFRFRYAHNVTPFDQVCIVNPVNASGITTISEMVIAKPYATNIISPAVALEYYQGSGNFSYSPALYYDFYSAGNNNNFGNSARMRLELGVFFYPQVKMSPVKIGLIPFINVRTMGNDGFDSIVYGGQITIRIATSFLQFF